MMRSFSCTLSSSQKSTEKVERVKVWRSLWPGNWSRFAQEVVWHPGIEEGANITGPIRRSSILLIYEVWLTILYLHWHEQIKYKTAFAPNINFWTASFDLVDDMWVLFFLDAAIMYIDVTRCVKCYFIEEYDPLQVLRFVVDTVYLMHSIISTFAMVTMLEVLNHLCL